MRRWAVGFLLMAGSSAWAPSPAAADQIVVGVPGDAASCIPFGCFDVQRFQQIYGASSFPGTFAISGIAFPYTIDRMSNLLDPATYHIRLGTTQRAVSTSVSDFDSSIGADAQVVFSGALSGEVPRGGALTFALPVPFLFDPLHGNLILDLVKTGGSFFGDDGIYLDANANVSNRTRAVWAASASTFVFGGLVTSFTGEEVAPVPEPSSLALFGTGVLGSYVARQRRRLRPAPPSRNVQPL